MGCKRVGIIALPRHHNFNLCLTHRAYPCFMLFDDGDKSELRCIGVNFLTDKKKLRNRLTVTEL